MVQASAATACAAAWSSTAVYLKDNQASQSGHNYTAKWWTQNESPATHSGQWDVWIDNGTCSGGPNPGPTTPGPGPTTPGPGPSDPGPGPGPGPNPGPSGKNLVG